MLNVGEGKSKYPEISKYPEMVKSIVIDIMTMQLIQGR